MTALLNTVNDICRYIYIYIYIYTRTHTHTHIYIHTYIHTYCSYYVQNSRGAHPHNQHIQQLPEELITAIESRRAHSGQLSTVTGNVVRFCSIKTKYFYAREDLISRVIIIEISSCSESPRYERFAAML